MKMPVPDSETIASKDALVAGLRKILPPEDVIDNPVALRAFESDGLSAYRQPPLVAVLPSNTGQVSEVLRFCAQHGVKVVPRGAGTSLSGGALPLADGVLLALSRFNNIISIDYDNRCLTVQPGVTNLAISKAVDADGFYYAPDPSSQYACSIGGNVAENAGGVHSLKYGLTSNNLLGLEAVLINGDVVRIGGAAMERPGYDILGLLTGSEGLLAVITEVTVRMLPKPPLARAMLLGFESAAAAAKSVSAIIRAGIIPAGMEMMDKSAVHAVEDFVHAGYPLDVEALLIVELDGVEAEIEHGIVVASSIAKEHGACFERVSRNEEERLVFWAGRKAAFAAAGRMSPDYYCVDGTIPRRALPEVLESMNEMSARYGLRVANVFHAGDGNLHPLILYDANVEGELERAEDFGADILRMCVDKGGVLTGEHGVGVEKRDLMEEVFSQIDLDIQQRVKCAFDPTSLLNPGKMFPRLRRCAELGAMHVHGGKLAFPELPRY